MTESPAWLGDLEGTGEGSPPAGGGPIEWREAVPLPPDAFPLWPAGTLDLPAAAHAPAHAAADPDTPAGRADPTDPTDPAGRPEPAELAEPAGRAEPAEPAEPASAPTVENAGLGLVAVTNRRPVRPPPSPIRSRRRARRSRHPAVGLAALIAFALVSAFFAWVSAEPLWLALGHATRGTVTVLACDADRCIGTFTGDGVTRTGVPVMGRVPPRGASAPARMTSARGSRAYVGTGQAGPAAAGLLALVLCGLGTAWVTGARRLPTPRDRRRATALSLAAPLLLLAATLTATF